MRRIVVAGDTTIDWSLAHTRGPGGDGASWNASDFARLFVQRGGAALLADLIAAAADSLEGGPIELVGPTAPDASAIRSAPGCHHSFALWSLHPYSTEGPGRREPAVWRVERFLGLDRAAAPAVASRGADAIASPDVVVLDDAGLGFRDLPRGAWPRAATGSRALWILVKMGAPVARGRLWEALAEQADRLVVVLTVDDLRRSEVQVSRGLSWERTAQDLAWELAHNPRLASLARASAVLVSLGTSGALLFERGGRRDGGIACRLFFDPLHTERSWSAEHPGGMIGYTTCLAAALALRLVAEPADPDLGLAVHRGLAALRALHRIGYGRRGTSAIEVDLAFPLAEVAVELAGDERPFAEVAVRDPLRRGLPGSGWTILEERYPRGLLPLAEEIVRRGPERALPGVPIGRFGDLVTVDRQEIESYRSIGGLIAQYLEGGPPAPLSIAVFGAPGSGKSFGVVQVARALAGGRIDKPLTFNLSQLRGPEELADAFHRVRDIGLGGQVPLVFWDEFDAALDGRPLGWLAHFLAPMQDGSFQQGQVTHPIGRAIFVFAGGTCASLGEFSRREGTDAEAFRHVKGPDFVSRIRGFVDVLGPNPRGDDSATDPFFVVRRAVLLRSMLRRRFPALFVRSAGGEELAIDPGVLRALLGVGRYQHGARSLESILTTSELAGRQAFERSALPSEIQLDLHVDGREFLALVQRIELEGELLERLAHAVHEVFCESLRERGFRPGARTDETRRRHSSLRPFAELPADEQEQNRGNARDIPHKLAAAGYVMLPARTNAPEFAFPADELERLAELEHERWLAAKLAGGWRWARRTDKAKRLHQDLLPWRRLSPGERAHRYASHARAVGRGALTEAAREKDRHLVREIPRILARIGYTVVPTQSAPR